MGFLQERAGKSMQMRLQPRRRVHLMLLSNEPSMFLPLVCRDTQKDPSCSLFTTYEGDILIFSEGNGKLVM